MNYSSLGTFEFIVRESPPQFYFLEVNPRLQVEHTITEALALGIDLVKIQLLIAQGQSLPSLTILKSSQDAETPPPLHSLQLRVTSEDVSNDWSLSVGKINSFRLPSGNGIRVDTHLIPSQPAIIGTEFDSLIAKIIVTASTWKDVVQKAKRALEDTAIQGIKSNLDVLRGIVANEAFANQQCDTQWLESNLPSILASGKGMTSKLTSTQTMELLAPEVAGVSIGGASSVLFTKGDAWSISLSPTASQSVEAAPSHLQLTRVLRNEFPTSLSAQITYTSPSTPPTSYLLDLASTTASFGSLSSASKHRRGDPGNRNHIVFPIAGKLMEVLVEEGDEVVKGDVVAVVRQMKMELEVRAGKNGAVAWVYEGNEGDDVGEGVLVCELVGGGESKL